MATARATRNHRAEREDGAQPIAENAGITRQARDQLVSTIQQGQQASVDAAQTWAEALSVFPVRRVPMLAGFLAFPLQSAEAITRFYFDVAADLLNAQREYVLQLIRIFSSEEPA
jgi:hypothetical protein